MPELPEVETIRKGLEKYLVGKKVTHIEVLNRKIFEGNEKNIIEAKVKTVRRFGKGLIIDLDNSYSIATHIKLTGQFIYRGSETKSVSPSKKLVGELPSKFTRVIFTLDKNSHLYFNDIRLFAWMKVIKTNELMNLPFFKDLGPEPFKNLTLEYFKKVLNKSNTAVKAFLLDQKKIGGIGNIYANDGLNLARIDPRRKASSLKNEELKKLYEALLEVLKRGLKHGGATELNFVTADGREGGYQNHFLVYGRKGEKCFNCGKIIQKIFLGGRGTYFCSHCQK